jgi:hypothetical protein
VRVRRSATRAHRGSGPTEVSPRTRNQLSSATTTKSRCTGPICKAFRFQSFPTTSQLRSPRCPRSRSLVLSPPPAPNQAMRATDLGVTRSVARTIQLTSWWGTHPNQGRFGCEQNRRVSGSGGDGEGAPSTHDPPNATERPAGMGLGGHEPSPTAQQARLAPDAREQHGPPAHVERLAPEQPVSLRVSRAWLAERAWSRHYSVEGRATG